MVYKVLNIGRGTILIRKKLKFYVLALLFLLILLSIVIYRYYKPEEYFPPRQTSITEGLSVNVSSDVSEKDIEDIADAGFKWVRIGIAWENVEKHKGEYDFKSTKYDKLSQWLKDKAQC